VIVYSKKRARKTSKKSQKKKGKKKGKRHKSKKKKKSHKHGSSDSSDSDSSDGGADYQMVKHNGDDFPQDDDQCFQIDVKGDQGNRAFFAVYEKHVPQYNIQLVNGRRPTILGLQYLTDEQRRTVLGE
jgi:hypothetical protein